MGNLLGGSSSGGGSSTSTQQLDPEIKARYLQNLDRATGVANNLGAQVFAPRTGDYNAGQSAVRANADPSSLGFRAMDSGIGITAANANTRSVDGINAYMNPYLNIVADNTLNDLGRANAMALNSVRGDAIGRKAFGGSRQALAEAETNRNFANTASRTLGELYNTGFNTALGASQADLNRNLTAANQVANLGNNRLQAGYQSGQNLMNLGLTDQQFTQQQLDAIRNLPLERQAIINQALGLNPGGGSGMQSNSSGNNNQSSGTGIMGLFR